MQAFPVVLDAVPYRIQCSVPVQAYSSTTESRRRSVTIIFQWTPRASFRICTMVGACQSR